MREIINSKEMRNSIRYDYVGMGGSEQQVAYGLLNFAHQQLGGCMFLVYINNTISGNGKQNNGVSSSGIISMEPACPASSLKTHIESYEDYYRA